MRRKQRLVDTWEGTLRETGGVLRPAKSCWYMVNYKHTGNHWVYRFIDKAPGESTAKVSNNCRQLLLRLEPSQSNKTLGILVSMDNNVKDQISRLFDKTRQMVEFSEYQE